MTAILGISSFFHDSAAAIVVDGRVVAAAQEERFTRKKHDERFPTAAISYCLSEAGLDASDLDHVVFYEKPLLKFERILETHLGVAPAGFPSFLKAMPVWFREKLHLPRVIAKGLGAGFRGRIAFTRHHESHAASAFFPSPFEEAAIITLDGVGEWTTTSIGQGKGNRLRLLRQITFPHSLGLLYSAFTYYCGFKVNSGEYKLMGLAPYGEPRYADLILERLVDLRPDGSFRLNLDYFGYCGGLRMTNEAFHRLFGAPPRSPEGELSQVYLDVAASIQLATERIVLRIAAHAREITGCANLCLAGGVALNCVANGRIQRESGFRDIWIQPASGDAGGALGAALFLWHQLLEGPRTPAATDCQAGSLLGPVPDTEEAAAGLRSRGAVYRKIESENALLAEVAGQLAAGKVVGWVQGRMEYGPRALGCRSILGDARSPEMQSVMNRKIKFRESFRPFAPIVLKEHVHEWFDVPPGFESPYMLVTVPVHPSRRTIPQDVPPPGMSRIHQVRSQIPAVTHLDYSARVQTVDAERHPRLHRLLRRFAEETGCPVLINTSFNVRGEPPVCTVEDAYRCFLASAIDLLVVDNLVFAREDQPAAEIEQARVCAAALPKD
jgi:carbamoyltransferase